MATMGDVEGNELFRRMVAELKAVIRSGSASAILAKVVESAGTTPLQVTAAVARQIIDSGQLSSALNTESSPLEINFVTARLRVLVLGDS
jgi:hypothetical protein